MRKSVLALLTLLTLAACSSSGSTTDLQPFTFMAGFTPQADVPFVGAYVAKDLGYFADEGLDVTIEHSSGGGRTCSYWQRGRWMSPPRTPRCCWSGERTRAFPSCPSP